MLKKLSRSIFVAIVLMASFTFADDVDPCVAISGEKLKTTTIDEKEYYQIATGKELYLFACMVNNGATDINAVLTADICLNACEDGDEPLLTQIAKIGENGDFSSLGFEQWTPIGTDMLPYGGTFDGAGYVVRGLFHEEEVPNVGLFGVVVYEGVVKNVGLEDSYIVGHFNVGGVIGECRGSASNVYNMGYVRGESSVGGVVGLIGDYGGSVSDVYNIGSVRGVEYVGGVVGQVGINGGSVSDVYNIGSVRGSSWVGSVVGLFYNSGSIKNAFYNNEVSEFKAVGAESGSGADVEGTAGKTLAELAALDVNSAFSGGSASWLLGQKERIVNNETIFYVLPGLKIFDVNPQVEYVFGISDAARLRRFAELVNGGLNKIKGLLTADICLNACGEGDEPLLTQIAKIGENGDFSSLGFEQWTPIGTEQIPYAGSFDGNGHTISGLYYNDDKSYVGLFGHVRGSQNPSAVRNVGVVDSYIKGRSFVGGVVGSCGVNLDNVYNTGAVSGLMSVGGVVGDMAPPTGSSVKISVAYNTGTVSGTGSFIGGIAGRMTGEVKKVYNVGTVSGDGEHVGGLIGYHVGGDINDCYNLGSVSGLFDVGGVFGFLGSGSVRDVYSTGSVSGSQFVSCVAGQNEGGTFENVYYDSDFCNRGAVGVDANKSEDVDETSSKTTAELAIGTVPDGFSIEVWNFGSHLDENSLIYYMPFLNVFENGTRPFVVNKPVVTVANDDVYLKSGEVTAEDFKVTLSFDDDQFEKDNSKFDFSKSTWGSDGVVKGTYDGIDFTVTAPAVVISSDKKNAKLFGTSRASVSIPEDVSVSDEVSFERSFAVMGENQFSTIMLPFSAKVPGSESNVAFYEFAEISDESGKWQVAVRSVNSEKSVSKGSLIANTPYLIQVSGDKNVGSITFGAADFVKVDGGSESCPMGEGLPWNLVGTYEYKAWAEGDDDLGKVYGFGANDGVNAEAVIGQFKKIGAGASIRPMRAYLQYSPAMGVRGQPNSKASDAIASLPENIEVVIVETDAKDSSEKTTVIGTINTRTGEFKAASDRYFDLKGRNVGKTPSAKGSYYSKKKVVK